MTCLLSAQGTVGSWQDHLSYSTSHYLTGGDDMIYSSAGASLLVQDIPSGTVSSLSRISGLNETLIGAVASSSNQATAPMSVSFRPEILERDDTVPEGISCTRLSLIHISEPTRRTPISYA